MSWYPPEWSNQPALVALIVPATANAASAAVQSSQTDFFGNPLPSAPAYTQNIYVFDAVLRAGGARVLRSAVQAPRMNSVLERWIGSCRRELLDRTLVWNQRHLMIVLREYEDFYNTHRPHRALKQAAPLRPLPDGIDSLDQFRVQRRDRAGGVIHEYRLVA